MTRTADWVRIGKWHRADSSSRTLCKEHSVAGVARSDGATALRDIRDNDTPVCGRCEARAAAPGPIAAAPLESGTYRLKKQRLNLTPQQREIRKRLDAEQARRQALRDATETDRSATRSASIRTVRGGLPGLGKRR